MGADIVNIVDGKFSGRSFIHLPAGDWVDLRAEIVRLRGELAMTEQQKADRDLLLTGTSFMRDGKRIDPATVRIETPAPAMPNGVVFSLSPDDGLLVSPEGYRLAYGDVPSCWQVKPEDFPESRAADNRDAAVPAGEAVAVCGTCNGVGMIGGHRGQTPDSYEEWAEDCPDCTPQPADGEAVGTVMVVPSDDSAPVQIGWHRDIPPVGTKLYTTPPDPVQAAPQEADRD